MAQDELCLDGEEWRDIADYEGFYQVSNLGRVRSLDRVVGSSSGSTRFVKGRIIVIDCINGRQRVNLAMGGKTTKYHVDTLVANAFIENPDNLPNVIHLDNDATNSAVSNLSWGKIEMVHLFDESIKEEWRDVVGYEGYYQVSNQGRVKSLSIKVSAGKSTRTRTERIMKQLLNATGYPQVRLCKNGRSKLFLVHRLVAEAFIPNPDNLPVVDHIDAVRNNNFVGNLRWTTQKENIYHAVELGNISFSKMASLSCTEENKRKLKDAVSKPVMRSDGKIYESQLAAARDLGLKTSSSISRVVNGIQREYKGYTFTYV